MDYRFLFIAYTLMGLTVQKNTGMPEPAISAPRKMMTTARYSPVFFIYTRHINGYDAPEGIVSDFHDMVSLNLLGKPLKGF
jgi:hypothetical protein